MDEDEKLKKNAERTRRFSSVWFTRKNREENGLSWSHQKKKKSRGRKMVFLGQIT